MTKALARSPVLKRDKITSVAGPHLRALRGSLNITTRQVEKLSRDIAKTKNNQEFYISHAWLTNVENGTFTPSVYKLYSLSAIYRCKFVDLLGYFGLRLDELSRDILSIRLPTTHLLGKAVDFEANSSSLTAGLDQNIKLPKTTILSRLDKSETKSPVSIFTGLNHGKALYGYIGLEDFTLYPLIRPGSFIEIDSSQNRIRPVEWRTEFDRPIYFLELRDSYICSWCELDGSQLTVVPHPQSKQEVRRFEYPTQAEIVGRVIAVAMRLVLA